MRKYSYINIFIYIFVYIYNIGNKKIYIYIYRNIHIHKSIFTIMQNVENLLRIIYKSYLKQGKI